MGVIMFFGLFSKEKYIYLLLIIVLALPSCMKRVSISTNTFLNSRSIPDGFSPKSSFSIAPLKQSNNQLFETEIENKIIKILQNKGYVVTDPDHADYYLIFDFGMTSSKQVVNVPKYVPGQSQTRSGNVYNGWKAANYNETSTSSGSIVYVPEEQTLFTRSLHLTVYDASLYKQKNQEEQVWQGSAASTGEDADLRDILDYLLVSVFKNFGKDSKKMINENVFMNSDYLNANLKLEKNYKKK